MDPITAKALLQRYLEGDASHEEIVLIEQWYKEMADTGEFGWEEGEREGRAGAIERRLLAQIGGQSRGKRIVMIRRMVAAAAVVLLAIAGAYLLFFNKRTGVVAPVAERYHNDVNPGRNAAVLTLAGGRNVVLNDSTPRVIGRQGDALVTQDSGRLVYEVSGGRDMVYNTLTTQKGNQYHLTLPDGTRVWLNASSSITFPSVFSGKQRQVNISGEAYFEVAKNGQQPFVVRQGSMDVEVLGTSFDVNGYGDEGEVKTTLLEGKVRAGGSVLAPGQQAVVSKGVSVVKDADIEEVMSWKNGAFSFKDAGIEAIMQQVERWYDVEVVYEAKIKTHFVADIRRDVPLSQLLKLLEETDQIHFRIDGRKVIVTP